MDADRKLSGVFEEKRTLLWQRDAESIEIDDNVVNLDLRKVSVVGGVQRQARRY